MPSDAVVLFDGTDLANWKGKDGDAQWKVENGYMEVVKKSPPEAEELGKLLLEDVRRHANGHPQSDDITIMAFSRNK